MSLEVNTENDTSGTFGSLAANHSRVSTFVPFQMLISVVSADVKVHPIGRCSIHAYAMEVFDLFTMIGKSDSIDAIIHVCLS